MGIRLENRKTEDTYEENQNFSFIDWIKTPEISSAKNVSDRNKKKEVATHFLAQDLLRTAFAFSIATIFLLVIWWWQL